MIIKSRLCALERLAEQRKPLLTVFFKDGSKRAVSAAEAATLALDASSCVERVQSERGGNGKLSDLLTAIARL